MKLILMIVLLTVGSAASAEKYQFHYGDCVKLRRPCSDDNRFYRLCALKGRVVGVQTDASEKVENFSVSFLGIQLIEHWYASELAVCGVTK